MISVVTPTLDRAVLLEETIRSVLQQQGADFEYIVIDGGSTDGTRELLEKYSDQLSYWVTEPDTGQYNAINKGFTASRGDIMAWIGSDDKYCPWAFAVVEQIFRSHPEIQWLTSLYPITWDIGGRAVACQQARGYSRKAFLLGENLPGAGWPAPGGWIQQESTFWRRSLWDRAGGFLDETVTLAADFELWARMFDQSELHAVATPLGGFRAHGEQRSATSLAAYISQAKAVLEAHAGCLPSPISAHVRDRVRRHLPARIRQVGPFTRLDSRRSGVFFDHHTAGWTVRSI